MVTKRKGARGDIQRLVLLLRTLLEKPKYRELITNILFPSHLTGEPWWRWKENIIEEDVWPLAAYDYPSWDTFLERDDQIFRGAFICPDQFRSIPDSSLGQRLLAVLLWFAPNLELLLLHNAVDAMPGNAEFATYPDLYVAMSFISHFLQEPILPKLSTLYLQRHIMVECVPFSVDFVIHPVFLGALSHSLTRLHVWRNTKFLKFDDLAFQMVRLKELKFVGAILPVDLAYIVRVATHLETLSVIISNQESAGSPVYVPLAGSDVNHVLELRKDTLKELEFRICGHEWYLLQLGPEWRLECLPKLDRLERLTVEPLLLSHDGASARMEDFMPPNLVSLTVAESKLYRATGPSSNRLAHSSNLWMVMNLDDLATAQPGKMNRLEHVRFLRSKAVPRLALGWMRLIESEFRKAQSTAKFSWGADETPPSYFRPQNPPEDEED
ncbi:hypothetical protein Hte_004602 [Hypoxylon texense]